MSFELRPGRYYIAVWILDFPQGNTMIGVFRDSPDDPWTGLMRIRTYVDDKVFESDDPKVWYNTEFPADMSEEDVEARIDDALPKVCSDMGALDMPADKIHKIDIHSDDPAVAAERLRCCTNMHPAHGKENADGKVVADPDTWDTKEDIWNSFTD